MLRLLLRRGSWIFERECKKTHLIAYWYTAFLLRWSEETMCFLKAPNFSKRLLYGTTACHLLAVLSDVNTTCSWRIWHFLSKPYFLRNGRAMNTALVHGHALYANATPSQASGSFGCDVFCWCKICFTPDCIFGNKYCNLEGHTSPLYRLAP